MSFLVTGAGMVGAYIARELREQAADVTLLDVNPIPAYVETIAGTETKVRRGNILRLGDVVDAIQTARADCVIHTAALLGDSVLRDPWGGFDVNVNGTMNVLEAARLTGVRRVVHASTAGVYDRDAPGLIHEGHPLGPIEIYAATKLAAEQVGVQYARLHGIEFVAIRYATGYGPAFSAAGSLFGRVTRELVLGPLAGRPVNIRRSGRFLHPIEFVYAADMAHGAVLAATAAHLAHSVYNIGSGELSDLADLAQAVRDALPGAQITIDGDPEPVHRFPYDLSRARTDLGYQVEYRLADGMREYVRLAPTIPGLVGGSGGGAGGR